MAGGESLRWKRHLGVRKHELVVDGETLLARMIRLVRERGVRDICLVGPYDCGVQNYVPKRHKSIIDGRLSVQPIWNKRGRTVVLMGDVWYSDAAMDAIVAGNGSEPCIFARFGPSAVTGKTYGEIFADSFMPDYHREQIRLFSEVLRLTQRGRLRRAGLWQAYLLTHGHAFPEAVANYGDAVEIDDWTEDFDYPHDWDRWIARRLTIGVDSQ